MTGLDLVFAFEKVGGKLALDGEGIQFFCPKEAEPLVAQIRENREKVFAALYEAARRRVNAWLQFSCTHAAGVQTSVRILWQEYGWSRQGKESAVTELDFVTVLLDLGYEIERGMIGGVCLNDDFMAAVDLERNQHVN